MGVESQTIDEYANQCTDPADLISIPPPSTGGGEGAGDPADPLSLPSPARGEGNKDSYTTVKPEDSKLLKYGAAAVGGAAVVAGLILAPEITVPVLLLGAAACNKTNDDRTLQPENDAPGGNEGEEDGPERIPPPKDGTQPDMIVADGDDLIKDPDAGVGDDDAPVGDDDAEVGDDDGGVDDPVDGGDDDGGTVDPIDVDGDGYVADLDCNDNNAAVHQNLYGFTDADGDGYTVGDIQQLCTDGSLPSGFRSFSLGEDCDDSDATLYQNLTGYADIDGDGYTVGGEQTLCLGAALAAGYVELSSGEDCDDLDVSINPSATEFAYDGIDQDCNGADVTDVDGDGVSAVAGGGTDCDDNNLAIYPGAAETPYNGVDEDCNGGDITDVDGDGFDALAVAGGTDCNDDLAYIHPGAEQRLNGIDTNCDGNLEIDLARDSVVFRGEAEGDLAGNRQAVAFGDVNGDGFQDVIIGAATHSIEPYYYEGKAYVLLGGVAFTPGTTINLVDANINFTGAGGWGLGDAVLARDLNGDGKDEVLIGIPGYNNGLCGGLCGDGDGSSTGAVLIVYGREVWEPSYSFYDIDSTDASVLSAMQMALIKGGTGDSLGVNMFTTGDIDGNGTGELITEAEGSECHTIPALPYVGIREKTEIMEAEGGHRIYQRPDSYFPGYDCTDSAFGDIDGDGLTDIVTADSFDDEYSGAGKVFTIFGSESLPSEINVASLASYAGLRYLTFRGNAPGVTAGSSLTVGDLDGDGKADVIIGVPEEDTAVSNPGKVYQIPASAIMNAVNGVNSDFPNGSDIILDGDVYLLGGSAIYGGAENTRLSALGMSADGDSNSDGFNDLIVGAGWIASSFYFDGTTLTGMAVDEMSSAEAEHQMIGTESGNFGMWLRGGADVNGDGASDTFVNDRVTDGARGLTYLFCGGPGN